MDIQLSQFKIIRALAETEEEWILKALNKLLLIPDETDDEFLKKYGTKLKHLTKEEIIARSDEALEKFAEGERVEIKDYFPELF